MLPMSADDLKWPNDDAVDLSPAAGVRRTTADVVDGCGPVDCGLIVGRAGLGPTSLLEVSATDDGDAVVAFEVLLAKTDAIPVAISS